MPLNSVIPPRDRGINSAKKASHFARWLDRDQLDSIVIDNSLDFLAGAQPQ